jgi:hypothetical protein
MLKFLTKNLVEEKVANVSESAIIDTLPFDETLTDEQIQQKIKDSKTKHPKFVAIIEGISNMDLKESVKVHISAEVLQKLFKYQAKHYLNG